MKITAKQIVAYIICLTIVALFAWYFLYRMSEPLRVCEERGWDGSEHIIEIKFSKDIVSKCNKASKETDAMIDVLDAIPFIEIRPSSLNLNKANLEGEDE